MTLNNNEFKAVRIIADRGKSTMESGDAAPPPVVTENRNFACLTPCFHVVQKMEAIDRNLIPTERYAQQKEQIINGELRAFRKLLQKKKR